ncbi:hypothetical protein, partial [Tenggerimyces flavus]
MTTQRRSWHVPAVLLLINAIPIGIGSIRLVELLGGPHSSRPTYGSRPRLCRWSCTSWVPWSTRSGERSSSPHGFGGGGPG